MLATDVLPKNEHFKNPQGFQCATDRCTVCRGDSLATVHVYQEDWNATESICVPCFQRLPQLQGMVPLFPDLPRQS